MKTVFTTGEAAKICKVSKHSIVRCCNNGQLKSFRVPGGSNHRRIPRDMLYAFMKNNGIPTDPLELRAQRVLFVADDPLVAENIQKTFLAADGQLELKVSHEPFDTGMQVQEWRPDAIILDLNLPNIDAKSICRTIRADNNASDTVIVCLGTGAQWHRVRDLATESGVWFVKKPLDVAGLVGLLRETLDIDAETPVEGTAA